jgi:hypothetical protein
MENLKKVLIFALGIVMALGVTPAFAASGTGTNTVNVGVLSSVSILVTGSAAWTGLTADAIQSTTPQPININSTSNVPINVDVKAAAFTSDPTGGNMPLSALGFGSSTTPTQMTINDQSAITDLAAGTTFNTGGVGQGNAQDVNLYMTVPFGTLANAYSTTVTWTASDASL